jgi:hypothetical protein
MASNGQIQSSGLVDTGLADRMSSIMRRRNGLIASSVMGMLLSLGEGCEPLISRQDAPSRYPLGCVACPWRLS